MEATLELKGVSLIGFHDGEEAAAFAGMNPATGLPLDPPYHSASLEELERAAALAEAAFPIFSNLPGKDRAVFLRHIAAGIETAASEIVQRANLETALPLPRLQGELARTCNQLRIFAEVAEEGSWVNARIDSPNPDRKPLPKPAVRSMLKPLGTVAVFGASNFPLAFSVAGGDTASAFAAGSPVICKAHSAHPATSELVGRVVRESVRACRLPEGVFSLIFGAREVGTRLVQHPVVKAVGFTGSFEGGATLMKLAAARPEPIPVYAEMGSVNPVFVLPGALSKRGGAVGKGLHASFTLGAGQMCTKPGMVFVPQSEGRESFVKELQDGVKGTASQTLLTKRMSETYNSAVEQRISKGEARVVAQGDRPPQGTAAATAQVAVFAVDSNEFLSNEDLSKEIFGPTTLLVSYQDRKELLKIAEGLEGHLTATIHAEEGELADYADLIDILTRKVGRLVFNSYPTGVEVCHAMVHGGPFPATSDGRSTSVGTQAIFRFARLVCYQGFPDAVLPDALKNSNPLGIMRMVDGELTRKAST